MAHKSCILDPIPAKILLECLTDLLPVITNVITNSLETAIVPRNLKCAALEPRLKKDNMNTDEYSSFRPISNLKFVFKCLEKVVATQLGKHIMRNNLGKSLQSGYKKHQHLDKQLTIKIQ
ncbi:Hypothetical predicted protein [Paramuricea clavata]|uniref:Uncharacterized protein n=1 Tax=Paramuricea clavata TaxID=317549 RepID=A0A7D9EHG1_PARCT|nr:Hypothetical predicted protein [Paramuricea clavata]